MRDILTEPLKILNERLHLEQMLQKPSISHAKARDQRGLPDWEQAPCLSWRQTWGNNIPLSSANTKNSCFHLTCLQQLSRIPWMNFRRVERGWASSRLAATPYCRSALPLAPLSASIYFLPLSNSSFLLIFPDTLIRALANMFRKNYIKFHSTAYMRHKVLAKKP